MQGGCPSDGELRGFVGGRLGPGQIADVDRHLESCSQCVDRIIAAGADVAVSETQPAPSTTDSSDDPETSFTRLGRYEIRRWLGRGGMGEVWEAFDSQLERSVALKVLRGPYAQGRRAHDRLAREAKLMARLSHPNVVSVHDLGVHEGHVFLVMELVRGETLAHWLRSQPRSTEEILRAFVQAGEGLAAAHDLGIIHRDFKPQNVLVGKDGHVRVTDFGLARLADLSGQEMDARTDAGADADADADASVTPPVSDRVQAPMTLTSAGQLIGTPRYMAPEQLAGGAVDARADQYAFCVALHEALFGQHPFPKSDGAGTPTSTAARPIAGAKRRLNRKATAALLRGLKASPDARFPAMRALLSTFSRSWSASPRRPKWPVFTVSAAIAGTIAFAAWRWQKRDEIPVLVPTGTPADWTNTPVLARVPDRIFCLRHIGGGTVRAIWGDPHHAEDIDINSGSRRPSPISPESYRHGCPELSPDRTQMIFEGYDSNRRAHIFHSSRPDGENAQPVVTSAMPSLGSEPLWLSTSRDFVYDLDLRHAAVFSLDSGSTTVIPIKDGPRSGIYKRVLANDHIAIIGDPKSDCQEFEIYAWPTLAVQFRFAFQEAWRGWWSVGVPGDILYTTSYASRSLELIGLNFRSGKAYRVAHVQNLQTRNIEFIDRHIAVFVARQQFSEIHFLDRDDREHSFTSPLAVGNPSVGPNGIVFFTTIAQKDEYLLQRYDPNTRLTQTVASFPYFSVVHVLRTGQWIVHRDDGISATFRCTGDGTSCKRLLVGDLRIPSVSPDEKYAAAFVPSPRGLSVQIVQLETGQIRELEAGMTSTYCQPLWSSTETVWIFRQEGDVPVWTEWDVTSSRPTGRTHPGQSDCTVEDSPDPAAPLKQRAWMTTKIVSEIRLKRMVDADVNRLMGSEAGSP